MPTPRLARPRRRLVPLAVAALLLLATLPAVAQACRGSTFYRLTQDTWGLSRALHAAWLADSTILGSGLVVDSASAREIPWLPRSHYLHPDTRLVVVSASADHWVIRAERVSAPERYRCTFYGVPAQDLPLHHECSSGRHAVHVEFTERSLIIMGLISILPLWVALRVGPGWLWRRLRRRPAPAAPSEG